MTSLAIIISAVIVALWFILVWWIPDDPSKGGKEHGEE